MNKLFADTLKRLRKDKGLSQQALADKLYVTNAAVSRWESGHRLPDAVMMSRIAGVLGANVSVLLSTAAQSDERPNVIMLDDNKIILNGGMPILDEALPNAVVTGFTKPSEAIEYAKNNRVALAFLDIEMGAVSGLDVCRELLKINPETNVVFLTAYGGYALDAWGTGASGFLLKPITIEGVKEQLNNLRYPFRKGD